MRHTTHIFFSIFILIIIYEIYPDLRDFVPFVYALIPAVFGALLPDIDHPRAFISQGYWSVISRVVRMTTGHRGWTHSLFGAGVFTFIFMLILWYAGVKLWYSFAFFIGYLSHLISDSLNPTKVKWLWPKQSRYGVGIIRTGSKEEDTFTWVIIFVVSGLIYLDIAYGRFILFKY